jgi:DNA end-binding protein Ku
MEVDPKELQLAKSLTDSLVVRDFDLSAYKDDYTEKLTQLIEAKVAGKQIVEPPAEEPAQVINLMEALQRSLAEAKAKPAAAAAGANGKPPKLTAPGTAEKVAATRKRKTS